MKMIYSVGLGAIVFLATVLVKQQVAPGFMTEDMTYTVAFVVGIIATIAIAVS